MQMLEIKTTFLLGYRKPFPAHIPKTSTFLNAVHPISAEAAAFVDQSVFFCEIPKGKIFLKQGVVCPCIFFVYRGLIRGFIKNGKRDITNWMTGENEMVTSISSFFVQQPAIEHLQALEDTTMAALFFDDIEKMYALFPETNIVSRKVLQQYYADSEHRSLVSKLHNADNKYAYFLSSHPQLANRVPLKYVASFLGVTMETLSRLRSKMAKRNTEQLPL